MAHGRIDLFEPQGALQLYVESLQPAGVGDLALRFEELKARLAAEGLFEPARKRPLPTRPSAIAVITSPTGAVWKDIANVLARRWPLARVILVATKVQGEDAPASIVAAFRRLERHRDELIAGRAGPRTRPQVTILARGGGSLEDLWSFNDERVVRAVVDHPIPVVCGVGHEIDVDAGRLRGRCPGADPVGRRGARRARSDRDVRGAPAGRLPASPAVPRLAWRPPPATSPPSGGRSIASARQPGSSRRANRSACCSTGRRGPSTRASCATVPDSTAPPPPCRASPRRDSPRRAPPSMPRRRRSRSWGRRRRSIAAMPSSGADPTARSSARRPMRRSGSGLDIRLADGSIGATVDDHGTA